MEQELSLGGKRVRATFNPSGNDSVDFIKGKTADLIDQVENWKNIDPRLAALAQTAYEEACMWTVKLLTTNPNPPASTPGK